MGEVSRRIFMSAAGAAALGHATGALGAQAATYDLVIRGGRVVDPAARLDGVRDVAIARGRIAAVRAGITDSATTVIDARGKLVVPGLIDIHTHAARSRVMVRRSCSRTASPAGSTAVPKGRITSRTPLPWPGRRRNSVAC